VSIKEEIDACNGDLMFLVTLEREMACTIHEDAKL